MASAWNRRTNQRAVENITKLVVELCFQMEGWRRLLRHVARLETERQPADPAQLPRLPVLDLAWVEDPHLESVVDHSGGRAGPLLSGSTRLIASDPRRLS